MFILDRDGRDLDSFGRYREYLNANADRFPPRALMLARSTWWANFNDHRSPHDGRLETFQLNDVACAEGSASDARRSRLSLHLRNGYDTANLAIAYDDVVGYNPDAVDLSRGHRDWRYDEFRVDDAGLLVHEIEWWGPSETARWLIVAADVRFRYDPDESN